MTDKISEKSCKLQGCCTSIKDWSIRHRKHFKNLAIAIVVLMVLGATGHAIFTVEGVVTGVSGDTITVTNFWGSTDVTLTEPWKSSTAIEAGDHVRIVKNLQGVIIGVSDGSHHGFDRDRRGDGKIENRDNRMDGRNKSQDRQQSRECPAIQPGNTDAANTDAPGTNVPAPVNAPADAPVNIPAGQ